MFTKFLIALTGILFFSTQVQAHPVAYGRSNSLMTWNSKDQSDWMLTHTFEPYYSLSMRYQRIDTKEGERSFYFPHLNFLLKRWNELDSQANVYFSLGHGGEKLKSSFKDTSFMAIESDWESRKYYVSFREEALKVYKKRASDLYMTRVRAGFSPYLAEFNELNSWFILQAETMNKGNESYTLTPIIRLFYKNVLTEFGADQHGNAQFNFMVHF